MRSSVSSELTFKLPEAAQVDLVVFNIVGQKVATLVNRHFEAGEHSVKWNARGNASGVYFYRIQAGPMVETKRMMLLK